MAGIHFDITSSNKGLVETVQDSTNRMKQFAALIRDIGNRGFDTSSIQQSIKSLSTIIEYDAGAIEKYKNKISELQAAQREAIAAGDVKKVAQFGKELEHQAAELQEVTSDTVMFKAALDELQGSQEGVNDAQEKSESLMVRMLGGQEQFDSIVSLLPPKLRHIIAGIDGLAKAGKAFIATPLGVVIAAISLALAAFNSWLHKSAEGQQVLVKITGYLSGAMSALMDIAVRIGKALYDAFSNPKEAVTQLKDAIQTHIIGQVQRMGIIFSKLGEMLKALFSADLDGVREAAKGLASAGKEFVSNTVYAKAGKALKDEVEHINDVAAAESKLNERRNKLHREQSAWQIKEKELDAEIAKQRNKMYTGGVQERTAAAAKAEELINQKYAQRLKFAKEEYDIKKSSNALTTSSQEDLDEENRLKAEVKSISAEREQALLMFNRRGNSAEKSELAFLLKIENELAQMRFQAEERRIAEIEDEGEREAAAIRLKYDKAIDAVRQKRREWEKEAEEQTGSATLTGEQEAALLELEEAAGDEFIADSGKRLGELLKQYSTYEQQRNEIIRKGEKEAALLREAGAEEQAKLREKAMQKELAALDRQNKDIYKRLAQDTSKWGVVAIQKAIRDAQAEVALLSETPEKAEANIEAIKYLTDSIEKLKKTASDFTLSGALKMLLDGGEGGGKSSLAERFSAMGSAWNSMSSAGKWQAIGVAAQKIAKSLDEAAEYMSRIAELTGDNGLSESAGIMSAFAQNLQAAGQGAASGGWIGAVIGGASNMLQQTVESIIKAKEQEILAARAAEQWAHSLELAEVQVDKADFDTVFGSDKLGLGIAKMGEYTDTLALYKKRMAELNEKYSNQDIDPEKSVSIGAAVFTGLFPLGFKGKISNEFKTYQDAIAKGYEGLQRMLIKTRDRNGWEEFWGAQDEYTALGDLAPELWDENGELIIENAEKFLAVNNQISDSQREQIQELVDLRKAYEEALKEVDGVISDTFGQWAQSLTDVIWDSVMDGSDAWEKFREVGSEAIANLGKQLIQNMLINEYLEQYREQIRKAYMKGNQKQVQETLRNTVKNMINGLDSVLLTYQTVAEEYRDWAEASGFDLTNLGGDSGATAGAFQTMSQDTADELNGRFTALQVSNEIIARTAEQSLTQLLALSSAVSDGNSTLSEIRNLHVIEMGHLEDIARYTKQMASFGETLTEIQRNTSRI